MEKNIIGTLGEKQIVISKHAYLRMKERNGWSKKAAKRMIKKVYCKGTRAKEVKGYLKKWINDVSDEAKEGVEYVLFGEKLYVFNNNIMLTVLPVPKRSFLFN